MSRLAAATTESRTHRPSTEPPNPHDSASLPACTSTPGKTISARRIAYGCGETGHPAAPKCTTDAVLLVTSPPSDGRLFVVEQHGRDPHHRERGRSPTRRSSISARTTAVRSSRAASKACSASRSIRTTRTTAASTSTSPARTPTRPTPRTRMSTCVVEFSGELDRSIEGRSDERQDRPVDPRLRVEPQRRHDRVRQRRLSLRRDRRWRRRAAIRTATVRTRTRCSPRSCASMSIIPRTASRTGFPPTTRSPTACMARPRCSSSACATRGDGRSIGDRRHVDRRRRPESDRRARRARRRSASTARTSAGACTRRIAAAAPPTPTLQPRRTARVRSDRQVRAAVPDPSHTTTGSRSSVARSIAARCYPDLVGYLLLHRQQLQPPDRRRSSSPTARSIVDRPPRHASRPSPASIHADARGELYETDVRRRCLAPRGGPLNDLAHRARDRAHLSRVLEWDGPGDLTFVLVHGFTDLGVRLARRRRAARGARSRDRARSARSRRQRLDRRRRLLPLLRLRRRSRRGDREARAQARHRSSVTRWVAASSATTQACDPIGSPRSRCSRASAHRIKARRRCRAAPRVDRAWRTARSRARGCTLDEAIARLRKHDPLLDGDARASGSPSAGTREVAGGLAWKHDPLHVTMGPYPFRLDVAMQFWRKRHLPRADRRRRRIAAQPAARRARTTSRDLRESSPRRHRRRRPRDAAPSARRAGSADHRARGSLSRVTSWSSGAG